MDEHIADVERIRDAVLDCEDVVAVSSGALGEIASYFPGRQVSGVRADEQRVDVHVVARYGRPLPQVADRITAAVERYLHGRALQITVEDILLPGETLADSDEDEADKA